MRIIQTASRLTILIQRTRPILKGYFLEGEVGRQRRAGLSEHVSLHDVPKTFLSGCGIEIHAPIRPMRCRCGWCAGPATTSTATASRPGTACTSLTASAICAGVLCQQRSRQEHESKECD